MEDLDEMPIEIRARNKRDMAYASVLAGRAVEKLFYAGGAVGILLSNELQRRFRDIHAGNKQVALNWDVNGTTYGQIALGVDPGPTKW